MYEKEFEAAKRVAYKAGELLKKRERIIIDSSEGKDIKLSSDRASEKMLMGELKEFGYSIVSEEFGFLNQGSDLMWIIDPLDGTYNYMKGMDDLACISLALYRNNEPIFGVVNRFMMDELFYGLVGKGAFLNDHQIEPSETCELSQAILATGFPVKRSYDTVSLASFVQNVQKFKKIRMLGTAAIMGAFVACGRVDAYVEEDIMLWDIAGAAAIVKSSGGLVNINMREDYKCLCNLFANNKLYEEYKNESV